MPHGCEWGFLVDLYDGKTENKGSWNLLSYLIGNTDEIWENLMDLVNALIIT